MATLRKKHYKIVNIDILIPATIVAYLLVVVTMLVFARHNYISYINKKHLEMRAAAYELEMSFSEMLSYSESVLNYINRKIVNSKATPQEISKILVSFNKSYPDFESIKETLSAGMFYWIDSHNLLTISSDAVVMAPIDMSRRDYLEQTRKNPWHIQAGIPAVGAASGQYVIPAGVGVVDSNSKYLGTTVMSFKVYDIVEKFKTMTRRYNADFAVVNDNGRVLLESSAGLFSEDNNLLQESVNIESAEKTLSYFSLFHQKNSYVIVRDIKKYPYKILVSYPNSLLTKEVAVELIPDFFELLIITTFFVMVLVLLSRNKVNYYRR